MLPILTSTSPSNYQFTVILLGTRPLHQLMASSGWYPEADIKQALLIRCTNCGLTLGLFIGTKYGKKDLKFEHLENVDDRCASLMKLHSL